MKFAFEFVTFTPDGSPVAMMQDVDVNPVDVVYARRCLTRNGAVDLAEIIGVA